MGREVKKVPTGLDEECDEEDGRYLQLGKFAVPIDIIVDKGGCNRSGKRRGAGKERSEVVDINSPKWPYSFRKKSEITKAKTICSPEP